MKTNTPRFVDGTYDITDWDKGRMRYYKLMQEQIEWNASRKPKGADDWFKSTLTVSLFVFQVIVFTAAHLTLKLFSFKKPWISKPTTPQLNY